MIKEQICNSPQFRRLRGISFLGAIDYLNFNNYRKTTKKFTRADHSIAVCNLAIHLSELINLNENERFLLVATALCHDIGHLAFSHTVEHVATSIDVKINHKTNNERILRDTNLDINKIIRMHNIDVDRVIELSNRKSDDPLSWIFHCNINIDTIDGIYRFLRSINLSPPFNPDNIIVSLSILYRNIELDRERTAEIDAFWSIKKSFYEEFLVNGFYAEYERQFISFMKNIYTEISEDIISASEDELISLSGWRSTIFDKDPQSASRASARWVFELDRNVKLKSVWDLERRYIRKPSFVQLD